MGEESDVTGSKTVGEVIDYCRDALSVSDVYFGHGTDNPWDESVQLVLTVMGFPLDSGQEILHERVPRDSLERIDKLLNERISSHVPLPYLLGKAWYAGLEFLCDSRAIIPRSPIAELIGDGFQPWYGGRGPTRVLDLCCGGGCIGLATAFYLPDAQIDLADISDDALALARDNTSRMGLSDRVNIFQSDLFSALPGTRYDIILSNPPYVDSEDIAGMPAEFRHEPELALASGADGLDITRRILREASDYLEDNGLLVVEVGNSWVALENAYPTVPFTWVEFEHGGDGVFVMTRQELQDFGASAG